MANIKNILSEFDDQDGRFNRRKYWIYTLIMYTLIILTLVILLLIASMFNDGNIISIFISKLTPLISCGGIIYISFTSLIKRLHDMDKSGYYSLILFIPLLGFIFQIYCGFVKGTIGDNKYGPDPLGGISTSNIVEIEKNTTVTTSNPIIQNQNNHTDEIIVDKKIENTEVLASENTETVTIETPSTSNTEIKPEQKIEL